MFSFSLSPSHPDMNPESPDYYMIGHCIDGRVLYPATGYLFLAWRTLVRSLGVVMETTPVTFEDVTIHRATILPKTGEEEERGMRTGRRQRSSSVFWQRWDLDVSMKRVKFVSLSGSVQLEVRLMPAPNKFEVSENGNLTVSGTFCPLILT